MDLVVELGAQRSTVLVAQTYFSSHQSAPVDTRSSSQAEKWPAVLPAFSS